MTIVGPCLCQGCGERVKVAITFGKPLVLDERLERRHRCPTTRPAYQPMSHEERAPAARVAA